MRRAMRGNTELKFELRAKYKIPLYYEGKFTKQQHAWGLEQINIAYNN